jgi:hypothetical protein
VSSERQSMRHVISMIAIIVWTGMIAAQDRSVQRNASRLVIEGRISTIRLAPGFTTTIRLPEPVSSVIVGDSSLFQAEHSPNEPLLVFVRPTTPAASQTNLNIGCRDRRRR